MFIEYEELIKTPEYWTDVIQNELYRQVRAYMLSEGLNQSQLAKKLGVTRAYVSQILNGESNFTIKKLSELLVKINRVPDIKFRTAEEYIKKHNENKVIVMDNTETINIKASNRISANKSSLLTLSLDNNKSAHSVIGEVS